MRLLDFGCVLIFCLYACRLLLSCRGRNAIGRFFGYAALVLLFAYTSLEINTFLYYFVPGLRSGAVSVYWGIFALALVLGGIVKLVRPLRFAGLALFALVAWKVFFVDLQRLDPIYRIVAFLILGIVLIGGAFVYLKFSETFITREKDDT